MVSQGNNGRLQIIPPAKHLCLLMECGDFEALLCVIKVLPNVQIDPPQNDNGVITVSFTKWFKYQMDSTGYERVKRSRYKRREEKIRSKSTSFLTSPAAARDALASAARPLAEHQENGGKNQEDLEALEQREANKAWLQNTKKSLNESEPSPATPDEVKEIMDRFRRENPRGKH